MGPASLCGAVGGEGFPCSEGPTHVEQISRDGEGALGDWKGTWPASPLPTQALVSLLGSRA